MRSGTHTLFYKHLILTIGRSWCRECESNAENSRIERYGSDKFLALVDLLACPCQLLHDVSYSFVLNLQMMNRKTLRQFQNMNST